MTLFLQVIIKDTGYAKKRKIKDAYPKKVCHMPTRRVKKKNRKKRKRKYSPYQKKIIRERIHMKEFHPPSTKNIHTLTYLDQGLWLVSPVDPVFDLAKYEKQVCHYILHTYRSTKKTVRSRMEKERRIKRPWWGMKHIERSERSPEELQYFFSKTL